MKSHLVAIGALLCAQALAASTPEGYALLEDHPPSRTASAAVFETQRGASLRETLQRWAQQAGWQEVVWRLPASADFTLGANARFEGGFVGATRSLVDALGREADLRVRFHHANRVVVVEPMR
jgi:hypothetical protein